MGLAVYGPSPASAALNAADGAQRGVGILGCRLLLLRGRGGRSWCSCSGRATWRGRVDRHQLEASARSSAMPADQEHQTLRQVVKRCQAAKAGRRGSSRLGAGSA